MADPVKWAEEHPYATAGVIFVGGLGLLWLFGFFGGGSASSSADTASTNMASAYYAAEAAQATAGTQLNMQQDIDQAATAQTALSTGAAVAINAANASSATSIASSMYGASTTIATTQSNDALAASQTANSDRRANQLHECTGGADLNGNADHHTDGNRHGWRGIGGLYAGRFVPDWHGGPISVTPGSPNYSCGRWRLQSTGQTGAFA